MTTEHDFNARIAALPQDSREALISVISGLEKEANQRPDNEERDSRGHFKSYYSEERTPRITSFTTSPDVLYKQMPKDLYGAGKSSARHLREAFFIVGYLVREQVMTIDLESAVWKDLFEIALKAVQKSLAEIESGYDD